MFDALHDDIPLATGSTSSTELRSSLPTRPKSLWRCPTNDREQRSMNSGWVTSARRFDADAIRQASRKASTGKPIRGTPKGEQCDALLPLANRRLLVDRLRARQVCSDGGGQHTERGAGHYQEFQHEHSPNHEGQNLIRVVVCSTFPGN